MKLRIHLLTLAAVLLASEAAAQCNISDAKLEEAILLKPELRDQSNQQIVSDLRTLRDAALILWSYDRQDDCSRILANIRELLASPSIGELGSGDEDEADQQMAAGEPALHSGGQAIGNRNKPGVRPLIQIDQLGPGLRVDEVLGAEVRSSDDKIIGEARNVVIGTQDGQDYVIVASGGFFVSGKESIVVPLRFLLIDQERDSFFLRITEAEMRKVPLMPDLDYSWLTDQAWRTRNDAIFESLMPTSDRFGPD